MLKKISLSIILLFSSSVGAFSSEKFSGIIFDLGFPYENYLALCNANEIKCEYIGGTHLRGIGVSGLPSDTKLKKISPKTNANGTLNENEYFSVSLDGQTFLGIPGDFTFVFKNLVLEAYVFSSDFILPKDGKVFEDRVISVLSDKYGVHFGDWSGNSGYSYEAKIDTDYFDEGFVLFQMERDYHPLSQIRPLVEREPRYTIFISEPSAVSKGLKSVDEF